MSGLYSILYVGSCGAGTTLNLSYNILLLHADAVVERSSVVHCEVLYAFCILMCCVKYFSCVMWSSILMCCMENSSCVMWSSMLMCCVEYSSCVMWSSMLMCCVEYSSCVMWSSILMYCS